jgi:hypothetical protein
MHDERHCGIGLWLQHDRRPVDRKAIALIRQVGRNLVVEDRVQRPRTPRITSHTVVCARQGLHSTIQRLDITGRIAAFSMGLTDETSNEREYVADAVIQLRDQQFLARAHLSLVCFGVGGASPYQFDQPGANRFRDPLLGLGERPRLTAGQF